MERLPWNLYQAKDSLPEAHGNQYYGTSFWEEFYFEANWQGDLGRAQICVFDLGFCQTWVGGGCSSWQKCWWTRFQLVGFGTCPFMIRYGWGFNMRYSRKENTSLLKDSGTQVPVMSWSFGSLGVVWGLSFWVLFEVKNSSLVPTLAAWGWSWGRVWYKVGQGSWRRANAGNMLAITRFQIATLFQEQWESTEEFQVGL